MNKGKFWQNGETSSRRNDAYRSELLEPRDKIITVSRPKKSLHFLY